MSQNRLDAALQEVQRLREDLNRNRIKTSEAANEYTKFNLNDKV